MTVLCLDFEGKKNCLLVRLLFVFVFPFLGKRFSSATSKTCCNLANPRPTAATSTLPRPPGEKLRIDTPQSEGVSVPAFVSWGLGEKHQSDTNTNARYKHSDVHMLHTHVDVCVDVGGLPTHTHDILIHQQWVQSGTEWWKKHWNGINYVSPAEAKTHVERTTKKNWTMFLNGCPPSALCSIRAPVWVRWRTKRRKISTNTFAYSHALLQREC